MKKWMFDRQLRYFLVCAQELSFTKAADRLLLSQSALSQQIREFERKLELSLFVRQGRGIALTPAGKELQRRVEPHFSQLDQIVSDLKYQQGISEGTIVIAGVHPIISYWLPSLIANYAQRYPRIKFSLRCGGSLEMLELISNRTADIGLIYHNVVSDLDLEPLFTEKLVAIFSSKLPDAQQILKAKSLLENTPLIMPKFGYSLRRLIEDALETKVENTQIETETVSSMLNLARHGAGVCFLPAYVLNDGYQDLHHCQLSGISMEVPVSLAVKPKVPVSPIVVQLMNNIKQLAKGQVD
ncbi:LysR family transcriptional regulator [Porticoccaceae bacterium]|nr:LysR family transcriptional regulator [Porticoccaceae bacterium]